MRDARIDADNPSESRSFQILFGQIRVEILFCSLFSAVGISGTVNATVRSFVLVTY